MLNTSTYSIDIYNAFYTLKTKIFFADKLPINAPKRTAKRPINVKSSI